MMPMTMRERYDEKKENQMSFLGAELGAIHSAGKCKQVGYKN